MHFIFLDNFWHLCMDYSSFYWMQTTKDVQMDTTCIHLKEHASQNIQTWGYFPGGNEDKDECYHHLWNIAM